MVLSRVQGVLRWLPREVRLRPFAAVGAVAIAGIVALFVHRTVTGWQPPVSGAEPSCVTDKALTPDCMVAVMLGYPRYDGPGVHQPAVPGAATP